MHPNGSMLTLDAPVEPEFELKEGMASPLGMAWEGMAPQWKVLQGPCGEVEAGGEAVRVGWLRRSEGRFESILAPFPGSTQAKLVPAL